MYVARFWSRRVKRLSPALVTMLAVSALALSLIMDPNDLDKDYFDSALFQTGRTATVQTFPSGC